MSTGVIKKVFGRLAATIALLCVMAFGQDEPRFSSDRVQALARELAPELEAKVVQANRNVEETGGAHAKKLR